MRRSLKVALTVGLSALLVALGVSSVISAENDTVNNLSKNDKSITVEQGTSSPASGSTPLEIDITTTITAVPTQEPSIAPSPVVEPAPPTSQVTSPTQAPTQAPAPVVEPAPVEVVTPEAPVAPIAQFVQVSQEAPGSYFGTLEWSSMPGATEYRIYKTGSIRPSWRLFYVYPTYITNITISDKPGAIALYKLVAVVNSQEVLIGEAIYRPTN
jgi:hypothetical protein